MLQAHQILQPKMLIIIIRIAGRQERLQHEAIRAEQLCAAIVDISANGMISLCLYSRINPSVFASRLGSSCQHRWQAIRQLLVDPCRQ